MKALYKALGETETEIAGFSQGLIVEGIVKKADLKAVGIIGDKIAKLQGWDSETIDLTNPIELAKIFKNLSKEKLEEFKDELSRDS